ncbi:hypothetical protein EYF80_060303 [Liparis tanakae]|uniref:Uncharacterized protein n=1 Tax=Liparis tanakae TaxID=230148 RepID=A0A4Z2EKR6_9TELE|nr:hypothetical protein EYF80_060303 [Liparis tanakae]
MKHTQLPQHSQNPPLALSLLPLLISVSSRLFSVLLVFLVSCRTEHPSFTASLRSLSSASRPTVTISPTSGSFEPPKSFSQHVEQTELPLAALQTLGFVHQFIRMQMCLHAELEKHNR